MSFDYNRNNKHGQNESFWTSNSDLFLGLSSIFLILYVVASLRSGADGVNSATENQKLKVQIQDLQNQLKTYESVKEQYIQTQASKSEKDEYNELMDKLSMLKEEAKNEKDNLTTQANENAKKEQALNKYQQMIRNMINSNSFAKTKVNNRNEVIVEKEQVIDDKNQEINIQNRKIVSLNSDIAQKQNQLKEREQQIEVVNSQLSDKLKELKKSYKQAKLTQKAYQARLKKLKADAETKVASIEEQKKMTFSELQNAKQNLAQTEHQLNSAKGQLEQSQVELEKKGQQISSLSDKLSTAEADTQAKMNALRGQYEASRAGERAAFEAALKKQKNLTAGEIAKKEAEFKAASEAKERKLASDLAGLQGQLKSTESQLATVKSELAARKNIAKEIKKGFEKIGVKADINGETGDVVIDFGQSYFESNSANLTGDMRSILQKAMPVYSKSLFGNRNVADQISAVEVIGFASPTYKGKFIDPNSTKASDREGLKYNMDLSYKRAKSIFNYILDNNEMNFSYKDALIPNLKVSGRSFLDLMKQDRSVASVQDYCNKNDCKKSQRVIIRFSMDKKK
jgi:myosin heavy subunit